MKLAAGYIVFDGLETLGKSILSVRRQVDIVIVSYQTVSWGGTVCDPNLVNYLNELKEGGLIDHLIEFKNFHPSILRTPAQVLMAKRYELFKRQECLELAVKLGATHYMSMDADEFYRNGELASAKEYIERKNLDGTAVEYINYVTPTLHRGYARWKVPFIYKVTPKTRHHNMQTMFSGVDPTRGMVDDSFVRWEVLDRNLISMHHMEMVRSNLVEKYMASSRFFPNRAALPILASDVEKSKSTKTLQFTGPHLGDSDTKVPQNLIECDNEFSL